jgi:hypothetical protein
MGMGTAAGKGACATVDSSPVEWPVAWPVESPVEWSAEWRGRPTSVTVAELGEVAVLLPLLSSPWESSAVKV